MKIISASAIVLAMGVFAVPALAQAQSTAAPVQGSQAVPGEGPGGSGADQSTKGIERQKGAVSGSMSGQPGTAANVAPMTNGATQNGTTGVN